MITPSRISQVWTIARLQLGRVFFSKRSFWVYALALFPVVPFVGHGVETKFRHASWSSRATPRSVLEAIELGDSDKQVLERAGEPIQQFTFGPRRRGRGFGKGRADDIISDDPARRYMMYYDGRERWNLNFEAGILQRRDHNPIINIEEDRRIFAAVFGFFYLRLAIFFGCLGIFINLFRGEMLDKTLHFWFLAPTRREVLLIGKYLSGLIASITIFGIGAMLCFAALMWAQNPADAAAFMSNQGWEHLAWYVASAITACVGYGSVFLASGLLLRNPIIPAVVILLWESINGVLPSWLQKLSVLFYAQSLTPVPAPMDPNAPMLIRLLTSPAEPPNAATALVGILIVTGLVLWAAARAVRRLEINYGTE
jgi:ABC-type transport system involved in multi-copper enzyme maturation permease subunit